MSTAHALCTRWRVTPSTPSPTPGQSGPLWTHGKCNRTPAAPAQCPAGCADQRSERAVRWSMTRHETLHHLHWLAGVLHAAFWRLVNKLGRGGRLAAPLGVTDPSRFPVGVGGGGANRGAARSSPPSRSGAPAAGPRGGRQPADTGAARLDRLPTCAALPVQRRPGGRCGKGGGAGRHAQPRAIRAGCLRIWDSLGKRSQGSGPPP